MAVEELLIQSGMTGTILYAIYNLSQRLTRVELKLDNHCAESHRKRAGGGTVE